MSACPGHPHLSVHVCPSPCPSLSVCPTAPLSPSPSNPPRPSVPLSLSPSVHPRPSACPCPSLPVPVCLSPSVPIPVRGSLRGRQRGRVGGRFGRAGAPARLSPRSWDPPAAPFWTMATPQRFGRRR
uniref:Uncharacterized protein n=1 Tax=Dromaius novaehollandiae TaxID=8790 RepID=A0A8C4JIP1_DRONO